MSDKPKTKRPPRRKVVYSGGDLPAPQSGSGITIAGSTTLEEFVDTEASKETGEALVPDKNLPGHSRRFNRGYDRYESKKGARQPARVYTRREINAMEWEKIMENQKTVDGVIASLLLSGREVTGRELQENVVRQLNTTKKKYSTRSTYLFHKTDFGKFIESRRDGKGAAYKLVPAALECKPEELLFFVHKSNTKARNAVLEHHKGLVAYLEEEKEAPTSKPEKDLTPKVEPTGKTVQEAVATAIVQELGVNVNVSGRIEIVFKLG